jgi:hypothetical protein
LRHAAVFAGLPPRLKVQSKSVERRFRVCRCKSLILLRC